MLTWAKEPYRVFIGYDGSESIAFDVCAKSIQRRTTAKVDIYPLRQEWLRALGIFHAPRDPLASTEFSRTRFLTPILAGYNGACLFIDSDFLFLADIAELFALYDPYYAVQCVQHEDYEPTESTKMGGLPQSSYPRKNWTSLMIFNAGHPIIKENLTPYEVNRRSGKWLHRLEWSSDTFVGALPPEWNVLENGDGNLHPNPKALHFTRGVPTIHPGTFDYADLWEAEMRA